MNRRHLRCKASKVLRFITPTGDEVPVVTRAVMREIDRIATVETGPGLLQMMEGAGRAMAQVVLDRSTAPLSARVLVLAGAGGNGGGGICVARHLAPRVACVDLCLVKPHRLAQEGVVQLRTYRKTVGREVPLHDLGADTHYDVVVDAIIGYGLLGAPRGPERFAIEWASRSGLKVFALDVPSGLDCDTGAAPGAHVRAELTVTLHLPKPGLCNPAAGELYLADLGIPAAISEALDIPATTYGGRFLTRIGRA